MLEKLGKKDKEQAGEKKAVHSGDQTPEMRRMRLKSSWNPLLREIYGDEQLISTLERFMRRAYCEENILFLRSANRLSANIAKHIELTQSSSEQKNGDISNCKIDAEMLCVFEDFVSPRAELQINVSSGCLADVMSVFDGDWEALSLEVKFAVFAQSVKEIELLVVCSPILLAIHSL